MNLMHNILLMSCSNLDIVAVLHCNSSRFSSIIDLMVSYQAEHDKFLDVLGSQSDQDLWKLNARNSCSCCITDNVDQNYSDKAELVLIHLNVQSLLAHLGKLEVSLCTLRPSSGPTILCLIEIWLKLTNENLNVPQGFNGINSSGHDRAVGRVAVSLPGFMEYHIREDLSQLLSDAAELVIIELLSTTHIFKRQVLLCEIYQPPSKPVSAFIESLSCLLEAISLGSSRSSLVICILAHHSIPIHWILESL